MAKKFFFILLIFIFLISFVFFNKYKNNSNDNPQTINQFKTLHHYLWIDNLQGSPDYVNTNYDYIHLQSYDPPKLVLFALRDNGVFKVDVDLNKNSLSEQLIHRVSDLKKNVRPKSIKLIDSKIIFSYAYFDERGYAYLEVAYINIYNLSTINIIYKSIPLPPPAQIIQSGGAILDTYDGNLLLAVGDFERSDLISEKNNLTRIIKIDLTTLNITNVSEGHRNIQGLFKTNDSVVISTEHGPEGGDEINVISPDKHYGWPYETYGKPYEMDTNHMRYGNYGGAKYGSHEKHEKPIFAFIPSVGIKDLDKFNSNQFEFPIWKTDFLACSSHGIIRLRFSSDYKRLIFFEILGKYNSFRKVDEKNVLPGCRNLIILEDGKILTNDMRVIKRDRLFDHR